MLGSRRESGEIKKDTSEQGCRRGFVDRGKTFFFEGRQEMVVDGITRPSGVLDLGTAAFGGGCGERLEGPEGGWCLGFGRSRRRDRRGVARVGGTIRDPLAEGFDLGGGELLFGGHFQIAILITDRAEEAGGSGVTRDESGAGVAAGFPAGAVIEAEAAFDFVFGAVAGVAVFDKEGADFFLEVVELGGRLCSGLDERQDQKG